MDAGGGCIVADLSVAPWRQGDLSCPQFTLPNIDGPARTGRTVFVLRSAALKGERHENCP